MYNKNYLSTRQRPILQGWLEKQKSSTKILGNSSNRRWFTIESIQGGEPSFTNHNNYQDTHNPDHDSLNNRTNTAHAVNDELALCYYKTPSSKDRSGWVFLSDVTNIREELEQVGNSTYNWIQVIHPTRVFKLRGIDHRDHISWLTTLHQVCNCGADEDDIEEDNEGATERQNDMNGILGGSHKTLEPARATYSKKYESYNITKDIERDHEAEIDFIRQLTSTSKGNDNPAYETYNHHNNNLIELESREEEKESFSPAYHEIITKSGIEQHVLLPSDETSFAKSKLIDKEAETDQNIIQNISNCRGNWNDDQHQDKNKQHIVGSTLHSHDGLDDEESESTSTPVMKNDHRLHQNTNANDADEPIHKRLGRAILSNHEVSEETTIFVHNNASDKNCHESDEQISPMDSSDVAITMVEQVSFDDESTGTEDSFVTSNTKLDQITDDGDGKEGMDYFEQNKLQLGEISFEHDILSLNHHHNNQGDDDCVPPDQDFMNNDWDKGHNSISESIPIQQENISFETNCSFLPDSNFVDEDWDA